MPSLSPFATPLLAPSPPQTTASIVLPQIWALAATFTLILAALGWILDRHALAGAAGTYIPMAPLTAASGLLLAAVLFSSAHPRTGRDPFTLACLGIVASLTVVVLVQFLAGLGSPLESWFIPAHAGPENFLLGRMSPFTACLLLSLTTALILLRPGISWPYASTLAGLIALASTIVALFILVSYAYGLPFLYHQSITPIAWPSALTILFLGAGTFALSAPRSEVFRAWTAQTTRGRLLRAFLPVMLLIMLAEGWADTAFDNHWGLNPVLWHSFSALVSCALILILVAAIAHRTAIAVDLENLQIGNLARFLDESPSAVMRFSRDGRLLYANRTSRQLLEYWQCTRTGQALPEEQRRWIADTFGQQRSLEHEIHAGNVTYAALIAPIHDMDYVNIYARDVTLRKQAENALRMKTALLEAQLNASVDGILVINPHGRRILTNKRLVEIFSIPPAILQDDDDSHLLHHVASLVKDRPAFLERVQYLFNHPNGTFRDVFELASGAVLERYARPIIDSDGRNCGFFYTFRDITARKQADIADARRRALENSIAGMEQVLGIVAHELRTPLAGMRVISELLLDHDLRASEQFDGFLQNINRETIHMSETVETLLEAARINSGRATWSWGHVHLHDAVDAALASLRPLVDPDQIRLDFHVAPPNASMRGDANAIRRLIINLLSNAQKHTSQGSIAVDVSCLDIDGVPCIQIAVSDTGAGIPPAIAEHLGEAFALNAGIVGANHVQGTGLGLAICKAIVAAHGGAIAVQSHLGQGTRIVIRLRADLDQPAKSQVRIDFAAPADALPEVPA